jgi:antitoxin (DNA-binding transcriptional repressor) of toxin-antitoxin stability system
METKITATELARNLSDILNRVRYKGERFRVERNGEVVAIIEPSPESRHFTMRDLVELIRTLPKPDEKFADDLEWVRRNQPRMPEPPW